MGFRLPPKCMTLNGLCAKVIVPYMQQKRRNTRALNLQDLKMTDQKRSKTGKCRTWKWRTKSQGWKMQDLENDGPNRRAGKCKTWKMTDQIAGLENAGPGKWQIKSQFWFWKTLTSILVKILSLVHSAANLQAQNVFFSVAVKHWISHLGVVVRRTLRHILAYITQL